MRLNRHGVAEYLGPGSPWRRLRAGGPEVHGSYFKMNDNIQNVRNELKRLTNIEISKHSQRYFKTGKGEYGDGYRFLGIRVSALRKLVRKTRGISIVEASELLKSQFHEERLFSLLVLVDIFNRANEEEKDDIYPVSR